MSDPLYRKELLRLAADAAGAGRLTHPDARATAHNPACGDRAVKPNGHVLAVNGLVKAVYLCRACEKPFVFVRAPRN